MKKILFISILLGIVSIGIFGFWNQTVDFYYDFSLNLPEFERKIDKLAKETQKKISTPKPLVIETKEEPPVSFLTKKGIIEWTNIERQKRGLPVLQESSKLNQSADLKTEDMLNLQYFSHLSPTGKGVKYLAERVGYDYLFLGENLARGNFKDDQDLVESWMRSLGHRENILNPDFAEIGISIQKGEFKGKETWLAVQHFGLPLSACPQPSQDLELEIKQNQQQIENLEKELNSLRREIRLIRPKRSKEYNQKVEQYNQLISEYNTLIEQTQEMIDEYNLQVNSFNECLVR